MKDREEIQNENSKNDAVGKVVRIMESLVNVERVLSVRELAEQTGIPRSTAHRFLTALENYGWATQDGDSGMYHAGLRFFLQRLSPGGYLLLHDCLSPALPGVRAALRRYEQETGSRLHKVPLCDINGTVVISA